MKAKLFLAVAVLCVSMAGATAPPAVHSNVGDRVVCDGGVVTLTCVGKMQRYNYNDKATLDTAIYSPKSVHFLPDGSKFYVNSLEGCATVVYDAHGKKLKVIKHEFTSGQGPLWGKPSGYYHFTHYKDGETRAFSGKPVESALSHGGRYLWVPYYRRTFDLNAQDPSAVAVIDTKCDSIVRMMETGPLPKMVACSNDGRTMAITHWGNNTVGLVDISSDDPTQWHHLPYVVVERELELNYSLSSMVNRDMGSGLMLRGTVFTPDDRYMLLSCMGGSGIAVIDMKSRSYKGMMHGIINARHLVIDHGWLYASVNSAGLVQRVPLDSVISALDHSTSNRIKLNTPWQVCHVGGGARTIEMSPSGRFVFAACNTASALYVVDTQEMKTVGSITVDSYPVGLDVSPDGKTLVVTSQGREGRGGFAVNVFSVEYQGDAEKNAYEQELQRKAQAEQAAQAQEQQNQPKATISASTKKWVLISSAAIIAALAVLVWFIRRRR